MKYEITIFNTMDIKQQKIMTRVKEKTNEMSPTVPLPYCLEGESRLWYREQGDKGWQTAQVEETKLRAGRH